MKAITNPIISRVKFGVSEQITEVKGLKTSISGQSMDWKLSEKEDKKNKVQTINEQSTEVEYPSAKAVYESLQNLPIPEQVQADWTQIDTEAPDYIKNKPNLATVATSGSYTDLSDKPTIPVVPTNVSAFNNDAGYITSSQVPEQVQSDWNQSDNQAVDYIKNKPVIPAGQVQSDWNQSDNTKVDFIKNKPSLATVATSGSYDDLTNKPVIPSAPVQSNWNESDNSSLAYIQNKPSLATVATSGSYNDLSSKPTIPVVATAITSGDTGYVTGDMVYQYIQSLNGSQIAY